MCAINRSSIFILLSIQIHLCDLTRNLCVSITSGLSANRKSAQVLVFRVLSTGIPCLLLVISYGGLFECIYFSWVASSSTFCKLIRYLRTHIVETGNEFSISDDEKTDNYELNVARHAFSCSMRSVHLLCSCMTSVPWLNKSSLTNLFCSYR
jgi:hypothetical protein